MPEVAFRQPVSWLLRQSRPQFRLRSEGPIVSQQQWPSQPRIKSLQQVRGYPTAATASGQERWKDVQEDVMPWTRYGRDERSQNNDKIANHGGQPSPSMRRDETFAGSRVEALRASDPKPFSSFLTDTHSRQHTYLRISLTERCNLRCLYCMPEDGVPLSPPSHLLTTPEIVYLSSLFVSEGVNKIRLTGGEPTVRKDIVPLMQQIGQLKTNGLKELCITTNGLALLRKLDAMAEAGLTGVNLSLDTLDPFQFQIMTRRTGHDKVKKSIDRILEMNRLGAGIKLKINVVVMRGINDREILDFVELGREQDLEVRFIEYMPFDGNKWSQGKMFSYSEMLDIIRSKYPDLQKVQDHKNDTSKTYQVPDFVGKMGFITSMTHNFCGTCNRLRITSDGNLKVCLFGNSEVSLRDVLREDNDGQPIDEEAMEAIKQLEQNHPRDSLPQSLDGMAMYQSPRDAKLLDIIGMAVKRKKAKHAGMGELENMKNRPMILIDNIQPSMPSSYHPLNLQMPSIPSSPPLRTTSMLNYPQIPSYLLASISGPSLSYPYRRLFSTSSGLLSKTDPVSSQSRSSSSSEGTPSIRRIDHNHPRGQANPSLTADASKSPAQIYAGNKANHIGSQSPTSSTDLNDPQAGSSSPTQLPHLTNQGTAHMVSITHKTPTFRLAKATAKVIFTNPTPLQLLTQQDGNGLPKGDALAVARIGGIMAVKKAAELIVLAHPGLAVESVDVDVQIIPATAGADGTKPQPQHPSIKPRPSPHPAILDGWGHFAQPSSSSSSSPSLSPSQHQQHPQSLPHPLPTPPPPSLTHGGIHLTSTVRSTSKTGIEMEALTSATVAALNVIDMVKGVDRGVWISEVRVVEKRGGKSGDWVRDG